VSEAKTPTRYSMSEQRVKDVDTIANALGNKARIEFSRFCLQFGLTVGREMQLEHAVRSLGRCEGGCQLDDDGMYYVWLKEERGGHQICPTCKGDGLKPEARAVLGAP
jgi:hypothetical protein